MMKGPIHIRDMREGDMVAFDAVGLESYRAAEPVILTVGKGWAVENEASQIVAIGGIIPSHPGSGESWFIIEPSLQEYLSGLRALSFIRSCRDFIISAFVSLDLHRIQAHIIASPATGSYQSARFVRCMGFVSEGIRQAWGPSGEDMEEFVLFPQKEEF